MKFALCLFAFLLGCMSTVVIRDVPAEMNATQASTPERVQDSAGVKVASIEIRNSNRP